MPDEQKNDEQPDHRDEPTPRQPEQTELPHEEPRAEKEVDEQWKERARQDKDQAPEQQRERAPAQEGARRGPQAPKASLAVLVNSIATQVFVSLGEVENPLTGKTEADLPSARFSIDLLQMLEDKTKGNLTDVETRYLRGVLDELRLRYVKVARQRSGDDAKADAESRG